MFRSYFVACLLLSVLVVFGGCSKKIAPEMEPVQEPVTMEIEHQKTVEAVIENQSVTPVSVEIQPTPVLKTVLFEYDSSALTASAQQLLKSNAESLAGNVEMKVSIEGHCDERGSDEYNLALGERRALATKRYLIKLGIDSERLTIISYGEEQPVNAGHNEMAWKQNRRVDFK